MLSTGVFLQKWPVHCVIGFPDCQLRSIFSTYILYKFYTNTIRSGSIFQILSIRNFSSQGK